jgi:amino acid adenylation domain-containing protein/FkbM family methyltransferase
MGVRAGTNADNIPIGRPIANTRIYLLDANGQPAPQGVAGEIHIGGVQVARGYLNRDALTAERFLPDPFAAEPNARMYKTGDLGRYLPDGNIVFLGRNDHQVKLRGFRIELGEIEAKLLAQQGIRDAVVTAREDRPGDKRLVAYLTADTQIDTETLRTSLQAVLPEYMVPAAWVQLEKLPLTPNSKLDRQALPAPEGDAYASRAYEVPQGDIETALASIWAGVLDLPVETIGRADHFFALGGHSLLAMRVVSRVRESLNADLGVTELFDHPVLAELAAIVAQAAKPELPAIVPVSREQSIPLSFAQQRLWFLSQMQGISQAYHIPMGLRMQGALDCAALRRALDRIVARHEALRTTFVLDDDQPVQRIAPADTGFALQEHDLHNERDIETALADMADAEAQAPFDLETGPLARGRLIRICEDEHVLLVTMHHIVSDGWSQGILVNEFSTLYNAYREGRDDPLPALSIQYADYAAWQRRWIDGDVLQAQAAYWQKTLTGAPVLLQLPTDRPRPAQQDFTSAYIEVVLEVELSAKLKALSEHHGTTLFMTLLAAWAAVLARLSGQDDLVIGTPVANRTRAEVEPLIGFFVNTLALRLDLSGDPSLAQWLLQAKQQTLAAQKHQDLPFEQVVELLNPPRSTAHSPLFQATFSWHNNDTGDLSLSGLELQPVGGSYQTSKYDLTLNLTELEGRIVGGIEYAAALFDPATMERHVAYLRRMLEEMTAAEAGAVSQLPIIGEAERTRLLEEWNATQAPYPKDKCAHELVEFQALARPDALAVQCGTEALSYGVLNERANRIAHRLLAIGAGPDMRVALCLERGVDLVVAMMAVLKAGAAYVPVDPASPPDRLAFMLADCAPVAILTDALTDAAIRALSEPHAPIIAIDHHNPEWLDYPAQDPGRRASGLMPRHLAYVIYTSGSTGRPKGVMVEHHNLLNLVAWHCGTFAIGPGQRSSSVAGLAFDAVAWEIWPALCSGATLMLPPGARNDLDAILEWWEKTELDVSFLPTPVAELAFERCPHKAGLRTLLVGGDRLRRRPSPGRDYVVVNNYGPTETTVVATSGPIDETADVLHIGRPIANTRIYLLDRFGQPVPLGAPGEIHIGGAGVARGYLNQPELTEERFLPDPFSRDGGRMYRTGDLARYRPDGTLEFLGRNDFQVKIRGFRIELGEIEASLARHPAVREVLVVPDAGAADSLLAYYIAADDAQDIPVQTLRAHLLAHLPEYMVPAAYIRLDAFPLTANGKIDRAALPAPRDAARAARNHVAPEEGIEADVARIWADLLKVEQVGRDDQFFELGGHSLLVMKMVSRIRTELGLEVPMAELFARPTLSAFASSVKEAAASDLPPITSVPRDAPLELSYAQQRLWFLAQMGGVSQAYHMPTGVRLHGRLDREALRRALDRVVARHEALRTTFAQVDGVPVQRIAPPGTGFQLMELDLRASGDAEAELSVLADEEAAAPFDLDSGPPIRGRLIRLGEEEHALLITMHHIVSDGWSMGILIREISTLYRAYCEGQDDPFPALAIQYADYAAWQRRWISGEVLKAQTEFWKRTLADAPMLSSPPADRPRPREQSYDGAAIGLEIDAQLTRRLKEIGQRNGVTLYMTMLAAWALVIARLSGQDDVVIGTGGANRMRTEVEPLIGFFVNTLALRIGVPEEISVAALMQNVKSIALDAQKHQDLPFEHVVEIANPPRSTSHTPLFQVMFAWQNGGGEEQIAMPGLSLEALQASYEVAKFDMTINLAEEGECVVGGIEYATALFDRATMERYVGYFRNALNAIADDDAARVDRIPLIDDKERQWLLEGVNEVVYRIAPEQTSDAFVHELFEQHAARAPHARALVHEDAELSYAELNERANRLARFLREQGVGPDTLVGLCLERGIDMIVSLIAVLKAGGAYVPLDPGYPAKRLAYTLADCKPRLVLTHAEVGEPARAVLESAGVTVLAVDSEAHRWSHHASHNLGRTETGLDPSHLAYVIYTSGSTGEPKGVMIEHRNVSRLFSATDHWFTFGSHDVWTLFHSFAFDFSVWEIWGALAHGGRLVIVPHLTARSPQQFYELMCREGVTVLNQTPSAFRQLIEAQQRSPGAHALRYVVFGGEALETASLSPWYADRRNSGARLMNMYGITETTVHVTCRPLEIEDAEREGFSPIGSRIPDLRLYLLDRHGQPVPAGAAGEIHVGGAGVARGYLNRPELSAERFVDDPFAGIPGARMYRSGDLARYLANGDIEFLGRIDTQVKVRGFRIELREIEARLASHPGLQDGRVVVREYGEGDRRLVGYAVPSEKQAAPIMKALRMEQSGIAAGAAQLCLPNNMSVFHHNQSETEFLYKEIFADRTYLRHGIRIADGDCIFDVGANIGMFTLFAASQAANTRIYGFEPIPPVCRSLRLNAEMYGLNAKLFECGLSDRTAQTRFTFYPHNTVMSSSLAGSDGARLTVKSYLLNQQDGTGAGMAGDSALVDELVAASLESEEYTCSVRRLSDVIAEEGVERIDLLKVDVENAEYEVLCGIDDGDWAKIGQVVMEVHDVGGRLARILEMLEARGFAVQHEQDEWLKNTPLYNVYAVRPGREPVQNGSGMEAAPPVWADAATLVRNVQEYLRESLPEYMLPADLVLLSAMPLTENGKLDVKGLPAPSGGMRSEDFEAPVGDVEAALAEIWMDLLKLKRVGRRDNFFRLGGHSMLAVALTERMRQRGLNVDVRALFTKPTLAELAAAVEDVEILI